MEDLVVHRLWWGSVDFQRDPGGLEVKLGCHLWIWLIRPAVARCGIGLSKSADESHRHLSRDLWSDFVETKRCFSVDSLA